MVPSLEIVIVVVTTGSAKQAWLFTMVVVGLVYCGTNEARIELKRVVMTGVDNRRLEVLITKNGKCLENVLAYDSGYSYPIDYLIL